MKNSCKNSRTNSLLTSIVAKRPTSKDYSESASPSEVEPIVHIFCPECDGLMSDTSFSGPLAFNLAQCPDCDGPRLDAPGSCPDCGGEVFDFGDSYACIREFLGDCDFKISKGSLDFVNFGKPLTRVEIRTMLDCGILTLPHAFESTRVVKFVKTEEYGWELEINGCLDHSLLEWTAKELFAYRKGYLSGQKWYERMAPRGINSLQDLGSYEVYDNNYKQTIEVVPDSYFGELMQSFLGLSITYKVTREVVKFKEGFRASVSDCFDGYATGYESCSI